MISLLAHSYTAGLRKFQGPSTTPAIDSTGATLLIAFIADAFNAPTSYSDSKGNTWSVLGPVFGFGSLVPNTILYAASPIVGTGHTFSSTGNSDDHNQPVFFSAWSGAATVPYDTANGNAGEDHGSLSTGSASPAQDNELIFAGIVEFAGVFSIDSGFTVLDQTNTDMAAGVAYLIQTTAGAVNPTWTITGEGDFRKAAIIASFKAGVASGSVPLLNPSMDAGFRRKMLMGGGMR